MIMKSLFAVVLSEIGSGENSSNTYLNTHSSELSLIPESLIISIHALSFDNKILGAGEQGAVYRQWSRYIKVDKA